MGTLNDAPLSTWSAAIEVMPDTSPVFGFGAVLYATATGQFAAVDFQTGAPLWTSTLEPDALQTPVLVGSVAYLATDSGSLYAVNPTTGVPLWTGPVVPNPQYPSLTTPVPGLGYVPGLGQQPVLYVMDEGHIYLVPTTSPDGTPPTPQTVYTAPDGTSLATSLVYDSTSGLMIVNTSRGLTALTADTASDAPWQVAWEVDLGGFATPATLAMGKAFTGTPSQTLALVDIASGESIASQPLGARIEQPVAVDVASNVAYVPTDTGTIFRLDATSATRTDSFQPGGQVTTPITFSDGLGYYGSADTSLYGFDLADPQNTVVSLDAEGAVAYLAGVSSGTTYFGTLHQLCAGSFANLVNQFNSQSQLMVDFVAAGGSQGFQQAPAYQTHLVLYDEQGNVRPNESVKIWAASPVTLMTDGQSFSIGPDAPAAFQSDGSGRVSLSVPAETTITAGAACGLSTPALTLWASFMDPDERILVYADERLHATLQTISGEDLQSATTYDHDDPSQPGAPLLPAGFQGSQGLPNAQALASAINNTISLQPPSAALAAAPYLAYPDSMLGVSSWPAPPDTTRPAAPGAVPSWTLDLSDPANVTFTPLEEAATLAAMQERHPVAGDVFDDIGHFIDRVINGVEQVIKTVWQAAEDAVTAIIHTAENAYQFVVETVEDAAHVVLGFLKSVVADVEQAVEKVIEALSFLFDWNDILATHVYVKALINDGFTQVTAWIGELEGETDDFFDGMATTATREFNALIAGLDGTPLGTAAGPTDPNQAYTTDGSDNYSVQGNWLHHKTMTNAVGTNGSVQIASPTALAASPLDTVAAAMLQFLEQVAEEAAAVAEDLAETVADAVKELMQLLLDPAGAQGKALKDLLTALESLVVNLVALAKAATNAFFTLLTTVVDAIQAMLNATLEIPFVSWLYKQIAGDELSILDLFALIVAVPITVMSKAISGKAPFATTPQSPERLGAGDGSLNVVNMITTFDGLVYTFVDAISNAMGNQSPAFLSYGEAVLLAIDQGLAIPSIPLDGPGDEGRDWGLLWLYGLFPVFWNVHSGMQQGAGQSTSAAVLPTWGIGSAIWQGVYAGVYPTQFFDDGIKLVQNECGALSTIAGYAKLSDNEEVLAGLTIADFFLDMANALIEIKYWHAD